MSNIKFYTNRQVALMMAIEARKTKYQGSILTSADEFYEWLQDAPMKDEDQKFWFDAGTKTTPK
jgi:uridine phosphorylase